MRIRSRRPAVAALLMCAVLGAAGCAGQNGAGPADMVLTADDLDGTEPVEGGPDQALHPLPPRPCADSAPPAPQAATTVHFTTNGHLVYEHVARFAPGVAARVAEDLRADFERCGRGPGDLIHNVVKTGLWGAHSALMERVSDDTNRVDAFLVGVAGDHLVIVMDIGDDRTRTGDLTTVSGLGTAAIRRAGGNADPVPETTPATPAPGIRWTTSQAAVVSVRRGTDPASALVELSVPAGDQCARDPRVGSLTEENNLVYAGFVVDSFQNEQSTRCVERTTATVTLTASAPLGDRRLILNLSEQWAPDGDRYRRCGGPWGCAGPPADPCDEGWWRPAAEDLPQHAHVSLKGCDGTWSVLEINDAAGACGPAAGEAGGEDGAAAGPRASCVETPRIRRQFMRFDNGWTTVSGARGAGCAGVHETVPAFPAALCEGLPAL